MRHLIGLLMAVFQVFATLHIPGCRKKEHETRKPYLPDDRGQEFITLLACVFGSWPIDSKSDRGDANRTSSG
jgi:hypothetical protein